MGQLNCQGDEDVKISFDIIPVGECVPNGYNQIRCQMIFDVKMEDVRHKARLVADGHMTKMTN